ncbi:MAG: ABC transporter permease [Myxococcales bacterium]|nr:ABC transporter permease [Myxococcales bacterium]
MEILLSTFRNLRAHAMRFGLTSAGIVWGAFMLTFLSATVEGFDRHYKHELEEVGPKLVVVWPGSILKNRVGERGARPVEVEDDDVDRIRRLHSVEDGAPSIVLWSQIVRAGRRTQLLMVNGGNEQTLRLRNFEVAEGRFLTPTDVERAARVAFLGPEAAERLFGHEPALGRSIQIESESFRVVGVAAPKGDQLMHIHGKDDRSVIIPYTTAQRRLVHTDRLGEVIFSPVTREGSFDAVRHTRQIIALHHDFSPDVETALSYLNFYELLADIFAINAALRIFLVAAGVITLLVGAVGVMNIMLVVVGERVNEIGLRKAVGGTSRAIFVQFLTEAAAVCGVSGVLGAGLGVVATQLLGAVSPPGTPTASPPVLDPITVIAVVASLVAVGMVAGIAPAVRAARIAPAEALRAT